MPTYKETIEQIKDLGRVGKRLLRIRRSEIKELSNILWEDEKVEQAVAEVTIRGILAATNKRLIYIEAPRGLISHHTKVEDFPYDKISSIQATFNLGGPYEIQISGTGRNWPYYVENEKQMRDFCEYVRARIASIKEYDSIPSQKAGEEDLLDKLEKLVKLKEQGMLSDEEFQKAKKRLLKE